MIKFLSLSVLFASYILAQEISYTQDKAIWIPDSLLSLLEPSDNLSEAELVRRNRLIEVESDTSILESEVDCGAEFILTEKDSIYDSVAILDNEIENLIDSSCLFIEKGYRTKMSSELKSCIFSKDIGDLMSYLIKNNMITDKGLFIGNLTKIYELKISQSVMLKEYSQCPDQKYVITNYIKGYRHLKKQVQERISF